MATYNSYVDAVIANGSTEGVCVNELGLFGVIDSLGPDDISCYLKCNPADYLESLADFHARELKLEKDDLLTDLSGDVIAVFSPKLVNISDFYDKDRYVLKAAAYDAKTVKIDPNSLIVKAVGYGGNIESPEEKEAFDAMTETAPQQFESLSKDEWDGEGLPPVGELFCVDSYDTRLLCKYSSKYAVIGEMIGHQYPDGVEVVLDLMRTPNRKFSKPETPEQRAERERDEAIDQMMNLTKRGVYSAIQRDLCAKLYDAGYRKETKQ